MNVSIAMTELLQKFKDSHPECAFKKGDRVQKVWGEEGDHHQLGDVGTVVSCLFDPGLGPAYIVHFDSNKTAMSIIIGRKIAAYEPS